MTLWAQYVWRPAGSSPLPKKQLKGSDSIFTMAITAHHIEDGKDQVEVNSIELAVTFQNLWITVLQNCTN